MTPFIQTNYQEKLKTCLVLYAGAFLCMYKPGIFADAKCGRPGKTVNSTYRPLGNAFNESDVIHYACSEKDYVILGSSERTCQRNGSWSDELPVCSKLAKFEEIELLFQDSDVGIINTIDGNISTCSEAPKYNQTIWRGFLPNSINISAVQVSVLGKKVDFDITVQEDNSYNEKKCKIKTESSEIRTKSTRTLTFYCPANTVGKYVHVVCNNEALRICEVSVLLPPVSSCLTPDIPLHGNGLKRTSGRESTYTFACHEGYKLWGNYEVTCQTDGKWFPRSPACEEIYCYALDTFENGVVKYSSNNTRIPYNGTAKFTCKEGFYIEGHSTIACYRWNEWNFPAPVCKPVISRDIPTKEAWGYSNVTHCEHLPHIANGALIVSSTNVGSIAWLKCSEGFKPVTDTNVSCLATGKWSSQSLYCKIIECESNPIIPHGKAILLNNSSYYGTHLEIKCNQGYISHAPIIRKCNEFESWGDLNICVEITCGIFNDTESTHGEWLPINGSLYIRVLICPKDFHIEGSPAVIQCLSNESWSYTSAKCQRSFAILWGNNWTPSLMLIAAVGAGAGTAILILCMFIVFLVLRKRRRSQTNTTVFHLENISDKDEIGQSNIHVQKRFSMVENYNTVESQFQPVWTNPKISHSALPNLPVDADPVYAQPFETTTIQKSSLVINKKDDLYNTHIYAEPIDSRRQTATHEPISKTLSRMRTDTKISTVRTNSVYESLSLVKTDQQNCDKKCSIYDSSSNSTLNSGQLTADETFQSHNEKTKFCSTLTSNLEYLDLL